MNIEGDYVLKLQRAAHHLADLEAEAIKWGKSDHHSVFHENDPDGGPNDYRVRVITDPIPPDPFAVLIGDVLHNLRGAIDHLAFTLMRHYTHSPSEEMMKGSQFPIFGDELRKGVAALEKDRSGDFTRMIGGIAPGAQTIIKSLQPYRRGDQYASHPLWILQELSNIDKHRLLLVSSVANAYSMVHPDTFQYYQFSNVINVYDVLIEPEAVVLRYSAVLIDPSHKMDVKFDPVLKIVFGDGSTVKGKGILETLAAIHDYIVGDVIEPLV